MPLIIDTYNLLHVVGVLPPDLAGLGIDDLMDLILRSRYRREKTILVCDGEKPPNAPRPRDGIKIHYSGIKRSADDLITHQVQQSSSPRRLIVVSSDREIQRAAAKRRCKVLSSGEFLANLAADAQSPDSQLPDQTKPDVPLKESQVGLWAKLFQLDPNAPPPEDVQPTDEDLEELLPPPLHPPHSSPTQYPRSESPSSPGDDEEAPQETDEPKPAPPKKREPILPADMIHEARAMISSEPSDTKRATDEAVEESPNAPEEEGSDNEDEVDDDGLLFTDRIISEAERLLDDETDTNG